jgi:hypothetical protein
MLEEYGAEEQEWFQDALGRGQGAQISREEGKCHRMTRGLTGFDAVSDLALAEPEQQAGAELKRRHHVVGTVWQQLIQVLVIFLVGYFRIRQASTVPLIVPPVARAAFWSAWCSLLASLSSWLQLPSLAVHGL